MCVIPWAGEYQLSWWAGNHTPQPAVVQRTMSSGRVPHLKSVDSCPVPRWSESPSHMHPVQHAVRLRRLSSHNVTDSVLNVNTHTDMAYIQLDRSSNRMTAYSPKKTHWTGNFCIIHEELHHKSHLDMLGNFRRNKWYENENVNAHLSQSNYVQVTECDPMWQVRSHYSLFCCRSSWQPLVDFCQWQLVHYHW